jgi:hypothetical protein
MATTRLPRQDGTEWVGEVEVPCFVPAVGQSVDAAAKALGYRVLARREESDGICAVIADGDLHFRCVKAVQS